MNQKEQQKAINRSILEYDIQRYHNKLPHIHGLSDDERKRLTRKKEQAEKDLELLIKQL